MRYIRISNFFKKSISNLKGKEAENLFKKILEIRNISYINHYKNLKGKLKMYKRVHVNNLYVILFFGDNNIVYLVDYQHYKNVYLKNYSKVNFK